MRKLSLVLLAVVVSLPFALSETVVLEVPPVINFKEMSEHVNTLNKASMLDTVVIHSNSYGGDVGEMLRVMTAIENSKATVITTADSYSFSAGAILALCGDKLRIADGSIFMFHLAVNGSGEMSTSPLAKVANKFILTTMLEVIFSASEVDSLKTGGEIWISGKELKEKLGFQLYLLNNGKELL